MSQENFIYFHFKNPIFNFTKKNQRFVQGHNINLIIIIGIAITENFQMKYFVEYFG